MSPLVESGGLFRLSRGLCLSKDLENNENPMRYLEEFVICWPGLELLGCLRSGFECGGGHDVGPVRLERRNTCSQEGEWNRQSGGVLKEERNCFGNSCGSFWSDGER